MAQLQHRSPLHPDPQVTRHPVSLARLGVASRLGLAVALVALVWAAILPLVA